MVTNRFIDGTGLILNRQMVLFRTSMFTEWRHMRVLFNQGEQVIPPAIFKILLRLCIASPCWVHKHNLGEGAIGSKYIYRLRQQIKKIGLDLVIENGRWIGHINHYRIKINSIRINSAALSKHPDFEVREMVN